MAQSTRIGTGQVTVTSSATNIVPANEYRLELQITKHDALNVYVGCNSGVTITSGHVIGGTCGTTLTLPTTGAVWGVTTGASALVTYVETTQ